MLWRFQHCSYRKVRQSISGCGTWTTNTNAPQQRTIEKKLQERYTLKEKIHRSEKTSELYNELLGEAVPFAPAKFRVHVTPNATENERKHRRDETIFKVQTQIKIMQDLVVDWNQTVTNIDEDATNFLNR